MPRKKNRASELGVQEKQQQPLVRRLNELITDPAALREYLSCSPQAINQYRLGTSSPTLEKLCKIADFYDVSVDYLLGRVDEKSEDVTVQAMCDYIGLSEQAIDHLHKLAHTAPGQPAGAAAKGYRIDFPECISELLLSPHFYDLFNSLCFYLIYGGILPDTSYHTGEVAISPDEWKHLMGWINSTGQEVIPRSDAKDLYLQKACDAFRDACKEMLNNALNQKKDD